MSLPTIDLSALMGCSLPMQIDGIAWKESPIVQQDVGKVATAVSATLEGFLSCADVPTLATAITALSNYGKVSGQDLTITGTGGTTIHQLLAEDCYEGGPHIGIEVLDADGSGYRRIRATLAAKTAFANLLSSYRRRQIHKPDGLVDVEQTGTLIVGDGDPSAQFPAVLASFQGSYNAPGYVLNYDYSVPTGYQNSATGVITTNTDYTCSYRINATELASALPTGGTVTAVDGEVTTVVQTDEQRRQTTAINYNLQLKVTGGTPDYMSMVTALRPTGVAIINESVRFSSIKGWRLEYSVTTLASADGNGLLQWTQTFEYQGADQTYEVYTYPGISPIAVARAIGFPKIIQSGSAMAVTDFIAAPASLLTTYSDPPSVSYVDVSNVEKQTTWRYAMLDVGSTWTTDIVANLATLARVATPTVIGP